MTLLPRESTLHEHSTPRKRVAAGVGCWLLCLLLRPAVAAPAPATYTVALDRALNAATVDACFGAPPPAFSLDPRLPSAALSGLVPDASGSGRYRAHAMARGCVHYALNLRALAPGDHHGGFQRLRDAILIDPTWLLALPSSPGARTLEVHFLLPRGYRVAAPAAVSREPSAAPHQSRWRVRLSTRGWSRGGLLAIGRMTQAQRGQDGTILQIAVVGSRGELPAAAYVTWIEALAATVTGYFGRFPLPFLDVLVVLTGQSDEVVPWGEVHRAGGDSLVLFVDRTRRGEELARDWVGYHEIAHLLHPYLPGRDAWWIEGLASYYQNVLRAAAGALAPRTAWNALAAGFARGRRESDGRTTLAQDSRDLRLTQRFMRVYWSGAAVALRADVELRLRSAGRESLSGVLARFAQCCLPATRRWEARAFMRKLDELAGMNVFESLYDQHAAARSFPSLDAIYDVLDLRAGEPDLAFGQAPASRRLREAIMGVEVLSQGEP